MLDLVPFAGPGWKVADGKRQPGLIRQLLQLQFPKSKPGTIAATAVGGDEKLLRSGIQMSAFKAPPTPNGGHREGTRVMVSADVDKAGIAPQVINTIGKGPGHFRTWEVMPAHFDGVFGGKPLLARIIVVADEFFLLGVDRNDRPSCRQGFFHAGVDMTKLRIPVGVVVPFLGLAIALQAVVLFVEQLCHLHVAGRVLLLA